jgi:lysophospholipase L1-like esterase
MSPRRIVVLIAGLLVLGAAVSATSAGARKAPVKQYYLSLGDSYAVGTLDPPHTTLQGYPNQLVALARKRGYDFTLVNFGCGGATTTSMLDPTPAQRAIGCVAPALAPGAANYPGQSQMEAALAFIRAHKGHVGLVTISIGGNDVDGCIPKPDPTACVAANMPGAVANLTTMVRQLRAAGGPTMRIIGSTYPDVVLGAWVHAAQFGADTYNLVAGSLTSFATVINPGLRKAYATVGAAFVDVTTATGAFGPFVTTTIPTYGTVPVPVAEVCELTYFCKDLNIHMTPQGYAVIARLEAATLPRLS